jgi:hypothetical protein
VFSEHLHRRGAVVAVVAGVWVASLGASAQTYTNYSWANFAGQPGVVGSADGTGSEAKFYNPLGVAVDTSGNVFVADSENDTIREVSAAGIVTTLVGLPGVYGSANGTNSAALFHQPTNVAVDNEGNLFVADFSNQAIRKVTRVGTNWVVTTPVGSPGSYGTADGTNNAALFILPCGVAVDGGGNVFVSDWAANTIRKVTPVGTNWVVTTLVGSPGSSGSADGTNGAARFNSVFSLAVDAEGNLFLADTYNDTIRKVTPVGTNWVVTTPVGSAGNIGSADGRGSAAQFNHPYGVAVDDAGNLYVADSENDMIRKVTPTMDVVTIGGTAGNSGSADGTNGVAQFSWPYGIAVDGADNLYVADDRNNRISKSISILLPLAITTDSLLPSGTVGVAYNTILTTTIGSPPYSWSVTAGSLTDGLGISTTTGVISGIPTNFGTAIFTARCTCSDGFYVEKTFSLTVNLTAMQAWQLKYFGCIFCPQAAPGADPLGKGMSNSDQFLVGLNPTNAASVFRVISLVPTGADFVVTWRTAGVRTNVLQAREVLSKSNTFETYFLDISGPIIINVSGDCETNYTDLGGVTNGLDRLYRVRLGP